ncbi:MAG: cytochrome B6 [Desulfuromonas sp.]|nr:MAG: cytochrome B6 [Desulfuromonas sp.]
MEESGRARRGFLKGLVLAGAAGLLLWKYLVPAGETTKKTLLTVNKSELPARGALVFRESRVAIISEGEELYALSLVCSHLGCTVNVTAKQLVCPCHGSVFNRQGEPLKGPAVDPLRRLQIEDRGDALVVMA